MQILKRRISKKLKIELAIAGVLTVAVIAYIIWDIATSGPITSFLTDRDRLESILESLGIFAPLGFIVLQILQTVLAPIPGNAVGLLGGYLFGPWSILWTLIGSAIGFFIVFYISRRFGRGLVEKVVKKDALDKFDFLITGQKDYKEENNGKTPNRALVIFFIIFLLPGLPDDIVCYIAGLTEIPIKTLMALVILGRLPTIVVTSYLGQGIGAGALGPVFVIAAIIAVFLALIYWKQDQILAFLKKKS